MNYGPVTPLNAGGLRYTLIPEVSLSGTPVQVVAADAGRLRVVVGCDDETWATGIDSALVGVMRGATLHPLVMLTQERRSVVLRVEDYGVFLREALFAQVTGAGGNIRGVTISDNGAGG